MIVGPSTQEDNPDVLLNCHRDVNIKYEFGNLIPGMEVSLSYSDSRRQLLYPRLLICIVHPVSILEGLNSGPNTHFPSSQL